MHTRWSIFLSVHFQTLGHLVCCNLWCGRNINFKKLRCNPWRIMVPSLSMISTSGTTLLCCVSPLRPLWSPTSSWVICLPLARSSPTITSATSLDGDAPPVSGLHDPSYLVVLETKSGLYCQAQWIFSISSWWQSVWWAEAGLPSCGWPSDLLQKWLVGQYC